MKKPVTFFVVIILVLTGAGYILCRQLNKKKLSIPDKLNCSLVIEDPSYSPVENYADTQLTVRVWLVNHGNDTVNYVGTRSRFNRLFCADNKNLTLLDKIDGFNGGGEWFLPPGNTIIWTIPPHDGISIGLGFNLKQMPDTTFKFRIGVKLGRWTKDKPYNLDDMPADEAQIVWSDEEVFKTNRRHQQIGPSSQEWIKKRNEVMLKKSLPFFYKLTKQDRANYTLRADNQKVSVIKASEPWYTDNKKMVYLSLPLKLNNASADTLKYWNMSCSWNEIYVTNNPEVRTSMRVCFKNIPDITSLPPHRDTTISLVVQYPKHSTPQRFRVGMSLQRSLTDDQFDHFFPEVYLFRPETSNLIWSNPVTTP